MSKSEAEVATDAQVKAESKSPQLPSAEPLWNANKNDVIFAQKTLKSIGFNAGQVDGIWGPRSALAIRAFEQQFDLKTAEGFLSELSLFMLEKVSNTSRASAIDVPAIPRIRGIAAKLDQSPSLKESPQLVFIEQVQIVLAKPNPFSEQLAELVPGTGIYVISEQDGWYEVESENKLRGFIRAN